ncbi:DUF262 domain-containing protein [Cobetia sp. UCD-24C]|uniref:DUF262 domain-containing protein n=1 Tax=Cobetia sp. UCD-24C TaxID=1716176 RepID=UPI000B3312DB|nr:DUF262 domain-containing protein [Cobetia sp. UCD-24C]
MTLEVNTKKITECLDLLEYGFWQIPKFQRDFVWKSSQVKELVQSILKGYPLGLVTVWDQPQNNPHTDSEPVKLKDETKFKSFEESPSVIKMVLDGKQRLTSLAMVFGGLKAADKRYAFSGYWYIDLDKYMSGSEGRDTCVVYYKEADLAKRGLSSIASHVAARKIPLQDYKKYSRYIGAVHNPATYPEKEYPTDEERDRIEGAINEISESVNNIKIPIAEIASTITLGDVCEIFDVLNTTGTKVSTFDLLHNNLFSQSSSAFVLKDVFKSASDLPNLSLLCDENRQEFFCQLVTGSFCIAKKDYGETYKSISTIKGKDLIGTPLEYYLHFTSNLQQVEVYVKNMFDEVIGYSASLKELPYPASTILYLSLRVNEEDKYTAQNTAKLFKAFYWRNLLLTRYDQGFLTQFGKDLIGLKNILESASEDDYNTKLDQLFDEASSHVSVDDIKARVLDGELGGALKQAIQIVIKSRAKSDVVTGSSLDWRVTSGNKKVQLHHVFPRAWCKNNKGSPNSSVLEALNNYGENCAANLIPLEALSNNNWSQLSPATAIKTFQLSFKDNVDLYGNGFIGVKEFECMEKDDLKSFLEGRAQRIAEYIFALQFV